MAHPVPITPRRDTAAWRLQVWISFAVAASLCAIGLAWLPGADLDRAFMVMGDVFCVSSAFALAKFVRDNARARIGHRQLRRPRSQRPVGSQRDLGIAGRVGGRGAGDVAGRWRGTDRGLGAGLGHRDGMGAGARFRPRARHIAVCGQRGRRVARYEPTTLRLGPLTRLGARATRANIAFDDHPNDKRFSDRIETVTVDSVFAWLQRAGLATAPVIVR